MRAPAPAGSVSEVTRYFVRLGVIAFGGPPAHIALMRRELVVERKWVSDAEFIDMLGVTNLIPGPNSTEMTMHLGAVRAGQRGLWMAGAAFIVPPVLIVLALAWAYVEYGDTPTGEAIMFGIQPIILAVIVQAIWGLRPVAVKGPATAIVVAAGLFLVLAGANQLLVLLGSGALLLLAAAVTGGRAAGAWPEGMRRGWQALADCIRGPRNLALAPLVFLQAQAAPEPSLGALFLVFLKIGSLLYGSGYVLVSFLDSEVVPRGWITEQELVDAVAVGQFTPGPVFTTATFVGYLVAGVPGALVATVGIFLPSFFFVALTHPLVPKLREWKWTAPFLDGVNAAAIALMAVVVVELARDTLNSTFQIALLVAAGLVLIRFSVNSAFLIAGGAAAGIAYKAIS